MEACVAMEAFAQKDAAKLVIAGFQEEPAVQICGCNSFIASTTVCTRGELQRTRTQVTAESDA